MPPGSTLDIAMKKVDIANAHIDIAMKKVEILKRSNLDIAMKNNDIAMKKGSIDSSNNKENNWDYIFQHRLDIQHEANTRTRKWTKISSKLSHKVSKLKRFFSLRFFRTINLYKNST